MDSIDPNPCKKVDCGSPESTSMPKSTTPGSNRKALGTHHRGPVEAASEPLRAATGLEARFSGWMWFRFGFVLIRIIQMLPLASTTSLL